MKRLTQMQPATLPKTSIHLMNLTSIRGLLSLSFVCLQLFSPAMAAGDSHLAEAEQAFAAKRFHTAEDLLNTALAKNPTDQEAHLLLARTFVQLLDNKAAEREYSNCIKCNPFSPIGRMAHQETINIGGRSAADKARPTDDVTTVSKSVDAINREANELKGGYGTASNTMTPNYYNPQTGINSTYGQPAMPGTFNQPGINGMYGQPGMSGAFGQPGMSSAFGQPGMSSAFGQPGMSGQSGQPGMPGLSGQPGMPGLPSQPGMTVPSYAPGQISIRSGPATNGSSNPLSPITQPIPYSLPPNGTLGSTGMMPGAAGTPNYFTPTYTPSTNLRTSRGRSFNTMQASTTPSGTWSYTTSDYQVQQIRRQQEDAQHAQSAQDAANNLERLMAEKQNGTNSTPKLRALGTNLFVRYYGSHDQDGSTAGAPAADPVVELKVKQLKLSDMK
jgi:hypothetical protein